MRLISSRTLILSLATLGVALGGSYRAAAQSAGTELINITNHEWRYFAPVEEVPGWQEPAFDDSAWASGLGLFAVETTVYPYPFQTTNFIPVNAGGTIADYFRTHFDFSGSTIGIVLTTTNFVDDGIVVYLNGDEVLRFNMPDTATVPVGQIAFNTEAPVNAAEATATVLTLDLSQATLNQGDNVLAVSLHQNGNSSDKVFGLSLHSRPAELPAFTLQPTSQTSLEGSTVSFVAQATGIPAPTYQWYFMGSAIDPAVNPTATSSTLMLANVSDLDEGEYYVVASNSAGTAESSRATLTVDPVTGIAIDLACLAGDNITITVRFSGDMDTTDTRLTDPFSYIVEPVGGGSQFGVIAVTLSNANVVVIQLELALDPALKYELVTASDLLDRFGNILPTGTRELLAPETILQEDLNGFVGTTDTEVRFSAPDTALGDAVSINSDLADAGGQVHALIRFDVFGNNPGQIPPDATIHSAMLMINQTDPTDAAPTAWPTLHRMLVPWDDSSTWNSMGTGVAADGVEAVVAADAVIPDANVIGPKMVDVTATVQLWAANSAPNYGWTLLPHAGNGFDFDSSEAGTVEIRPKLIVCYTEQVNPIQIIGQPRGTNVNERQQITLTVVVRGSNPQFQWRKGGVDIAGANSATFVISNAVPADEGTYTVFVQNDIPSSELSDPAVVDVIVDTVPPTVVSARGEANLTDITIAFSEPVTAGTAEDESNYSLAPALSIVSATLANPSTVVLTTAARTFGTDYTLTIRDIRDTAVTPNTLSPNPTMVTIHSRTWRLIGQGEMWRYEQSNDLHAVGWPNVDNSLLPNEGPGLFGLETAGVVAGLNYLNPQIGTALTIGATQPVYYFRKTVTLPTIPAGAIYAARLYADDSVILYIDGAEAARIRETNDPPAYVFSGLTGPPVEGTIECVQLNTSAGEHRIDVELHNTSGTSSDVLFGGEIVALVRPSLGISQDGTGVHVRWDADPNWGLVASTNVTGPYAPVAGNPAGSLTATNRTGNTFYQLLCR